MKEGIYITFNKAYLNKFELDKTNDIGSILFLEPLRDELIDECNGYNVLLLTKNNMKFLPTFSNGRLNKMMFFQPTKEQVIEYHVIREEYEIAEEINSKEWKQDTELTFTPVSNSLSRLKIK